MRRQFFLAPLCALALSGPALAADLGPPPPPIPVFTWTGIYVGGQIGFAWEQNVTIPSVSAIDPFGDYFFATFSKGGPQGVIGGAHVGYNYQFSQWVVGLEGSVDGTGLQRTFFGTVTDIFGNDLGAVNAFTRSEIQGSIRGRFGIAFDHSLLYATGGVAFAGFNASITDTTGFFTGFPGLTASSSTTRAGWTVGGGIEYAITDNWSVRGEYRYSSFGNLTSSSFPGLAAPLVVTSRFQLRENQVQAGFSYKFDTFAPAPIIAKY
ncbi:MAG TPA: outer membrane protein [Methylocella sp.]|nr:outer membrane protein [Methylocella sp.]